MSIITKVTVEISNTDGVCKVQDEIGEGDAVPSLLIVAKFKEHMGRWNMLDASTMMRSVYEATLVRRHISYSIPQKYAPCLLLYVSMYPVVN